MIEYRRHFLASVATLAVASCGAPSNTTQPRDTAANNSDRITREPSSGESGTPAMTPVADATPGANPSGVSLSRAAPAPSALFNAAYQRVESDWEQILYLCDGVDGDRVKLITMPNAKGLSVLWTYRKADFRTKRETIRLSDDDPGAGQIMREIQRSDGSAFGSVHSINPGVLGNVDVTILPTLTGITDRNESTRCRWEPRGRVLLFDGRRSVLVIGNEDGSYTYKSFDYAKPGKIIDAGGGATSTPSTTVKGGRLVPAEPNHEVYEFRNGPWTYRVSASGDNRAPGAGLTVLRNGKAVQTSVAAAYQMAAKRIE